MTEVYNRAQVVEWGYPVEVIASPHFAKRDRIQQLHQQIEEALLIRLLRLNDQNFLLL